jgi:hypothetical protein
MLIKAKLPAGEEIQQLNELLATDLNPQQKFLVQRELKYHLCDSTNQHTSTELINFYYQDSPNWAVLHDLRIQNNGYNLQIDHILVNRSFDIYILNAKNYTYGLKITADGEFLIYDGTQYQPIESPVEAGREKIASLSEALRANSVLPKRWGMSIRPKIHYYVIFSPQSDIMRPPKWIFDSSMVVTADFLVKSVLRKPKKLKRTVDRLKSLPKIFNRRVLIACTQKLAALDSPKFTDYQQLLGFEYLPLPVAAADGIKSPNCDYMI